MYKAKTCAEKKVNGMKNFFSFIII